MNDAEIVEAIAVRWFCGGYLDGGKWEAQPDNIKDGFRHKARLFWANPDRLLTDFRALHHSIVNAEAHSRRDLDIWK